MRTLLTTSAYQPSNSFQRWREAIFERIVPVELTKIGERPFEGRLEAVDVGCLLISRVTQRAIRTVATPETIRRHQKHDTLSVIVMLSGSVNLEQSGRTAIQREGDLVVLDRKPATMATRTTASRSLVLEIPRARLERMLGPARLYAGLTIGATQASTSHVTTFFDELIRVQTRFDAATAERMSAIGVDLLVASIAERLAQEVPKPLHGTVVVQRAKAYVESNLGDPTLDPPQVAAAMGVSLRRLQELFHEHGRHVSDWIWQRRLAVAAAHLADPGYRHLSIGSLAHDCGFSSQAHFARRFRDRYGMTPSACRESADQARLASGKPFGPGNRVRPGLEG